MSKTISLNDFLTYVDQNFDRFTQFIQNDENLKELLFKVSFEQMININFSNKSRLRIYLKVLFAFLEMDTFFQYEDIIRICCDFVLYNLSLIKNDVNTVKVLLKLFVTIVKRFTILHPANSLQDLFDLSRVLEILTLVNGNQDFNENCAKYSGILLKSILHLNSPNIDSDLICELFNTFRKNHVLNTLIFFAEYVLTRNRDTYCLYDNIVNWLVSDAPFELDHTKSKRTISTLLAVLTKYSNAEMNTISEDEGFFTEIQCQFERALSKQLHVLYILSNCPEFRIYCLELLTYLLHRLYRKYRIIWEENKWYGELFDLPQDYKKWPQSPKMNQVFVLILYITFQSESISRPKEWTQMVLIEYLQRCFYRIRPTDFGILKALYFLYPSLMAESSTTTDSLSLKAFESDLLKYWSTHSFISILFTQHPIQLKWVLQGNVVPLKLAIVKHWLKNETKIETLADILRQTSGFWVLFTILKQNDIETDEFQRISILIQKLKDSSISIGISLILPKVFQLPRIFNALMLSRPGVPTGTHQRVFISAFMGAILPLIKQEDVLRAATDFSYRLLFKSRKSTNYPMVLGRFVRNPLTIPHLLDTLRNGNAQIKSISIKFLYQIAISSTNLKEPEEILINPMNLLNSNSTEADVKGLQLLHKIITLTDGNCCIFKFSNQFLLKIYENLINLCFVGRTATSACACLTRMMEQMNFFAGLFVTNCTIESLCVHLNVPETDEQFLLIFLQFIEIWLQKILLHFPMDSVMVPKLVIQSFVYRMSNIQQDLVKNVIQLLDQIPSFEAFQCPTICI